MNVAPAQLAVIIPTLNEAACIAQTVHCVFDRAGEVAVGCIIADGGSSDATCDIAVAAGARVVMHAGGRGAQQNAGAAIADAPVLLFLHADCIPPQAYAEIILSVLAQPTIAIAAFRLAIDAPGWPLRLVEAGANLRSRWLGLPYGDQGLAMRASDFAAWGGFPDQPIMEDYALVRQAGRLGRIALMPAPARVSARRWQKLGVLRTTLTNQSMLVGHALGVSSQRLARWYRAR